MDSSRKRTLATLSLALIFLLLGCVVGSPTATPAVDTPSLPAETLEAAPTESVEQPAETAPAAETPADPNAPAPAADLDETFEPFWQTWTLLHRYYVDQPLDDAALVQGAVAGLDALVPPSGAPASEDVAGAFSAAADTPSELESLFTTFWQSWVGARAASTESDVLLMRAALTGMVDSIGDQHTFYMDPDELFQSSIPIDGSYEGIGAWVDTETEFLTIVSPMPGSPAEAAGLKPGDQIVKVDGEDMTGIDGNQVIRRVLGPAGTEVTLTVRREGVADFDVTIVRATITIPSVTGEILEGTNIAYVQLSQFGETTSEDFRNILEELLAQNPDGLIFDLRNNGGGLLTTAIEVASEFIPEGVIMYEVYGDGSRDVYEALEGGVATEIPLVVLINEGSASASEIVAGAIQDTGRAQLVGMTSFGKGSVQNWLPLADDGAVRITIARWYTPNERLIHEVGLTPDVVVELTEEDFNAGLDPQLEKAIELLTQN